MDRPILPYERGPLDLQPWDAATREVAVRVAGLVNAARPDLVVEHIGSTAVPGLPGKNVVDLAIEADATDVATVTRSLGDLGFVRTTGPRAFPATRPLLVGALDHDGRRYRIHVHVHPRGHRLYGREHARDIAFRDALRADADLRDAYAERKREIAEAGIEDTYRYSMAKTAWIRGTIERLGMAEPPILPPAAIGVVGGGQLGRMLALAARQLGFRVSVLDPDPDCPAAGVVDRVIVGRYDSVQAGLELAEHCDVVTVELEHVGLPMIEALDREWPVRPGVWAVAVTQDRIEERRFVEGERIAVAPWRVVGDDAEVVAAARDLGLPIRLKAARGGYDGRRQVVIRTPAAAERGFADLGLQPGGGAIAERELDFAAELSVVVARGVDGQSVTYPVARNRHHDGILVESVAPAGVDPDTAAAAQAIGARLAEGLDLVGTLTVELFLLKDGTLAVNELAPRVHNSGHWTIEGCVTSQFEQHVRAICGLPLGPTALRTGAAVTVNLLGIGGDRPARPTGLAAALAARDVHPHLYDKRRVFERRKMGHVTAVAEQPETALAAARAAAGQIGWEG